MTDEALSGLPIGWIEATMGDCADIQLGKMLDKTKNKGDSTPYLRNRNVRWGSFDLSDVLEMRFTPEERAFFSIENNDLIVCEGGEPGRAAIWRSGPTELKYQKALHRVRLSEGVVPDFVYYFLRHVSQQGLLDSLLTGTTIKHLPRTAFLRLKLSLPPTNEQRRIVAKLDSLFDCTRRAREELSQIPRLIEHYKGAILKAAFRGDLTKDWRKLHGIQRHAWEVNRIGDLASFIFDGPFGSHLKSDDYVSEGVRVVRLENIGHLEFIESKRTYISQEKYNTLKKHTLAAGDLMFSSFVDEQVRVCLVPASIKESSINKADCFCIRTNPEIANNRWLELRLASQQSYNDLRSKVHGATRPRINLKTLKMYEIQIPTIGEQEEMVERIERELDWLKVLDSEQSQAAHLLEHLDQANLAKAFRGELVPQDPNDEPASVLLGRIRAEQAGNHRSGADAEGWLRPRRRRWCSDA